MSEKSHIKRQRPKVSFLEDKSTSDNKRIKTESQDVEDRDYYTLDSDVFAPKSRRKQLKNEETDSNDDDESQSLDSVDSTDQDDPEKTVTKLYNGDVEGEEFSERSEYAEDDIRIIPFNMAQELEEGTIDKSGCYVPSRDKDEVHDTWLQGITRADVKKAKEAHDKQLRKRELADCRMESDSKIDSNQAWLRILEHLHQGESVAKAMRRLSPQNKSNKQSKKCKTHKLDKHYNSTVQSHDVDKNEAAETSRVREQMLGVLVNCSSLLTETGEYDVLELTYEQIVRKLRLAGVLPDTWKPMDPLPII